MRSLWRIDRARGDAADVLLLNDISSQKKPPENSGALSPSLRRSTSFFYSENTNCRKCPGTWIRRACFARSPRVCPVQSTWGATGPKMRQRRPPSPRSRAVVPRRPTGGRRWPASWRRARQQGLQHLTEFQPCHLAGLLLLVSKKCACHPPFVLILIAELYQLHDCCLAI